MHEQPAKRRGVIQKTIDIHPLPVAFRSDIPHMLGGSLPPFHQDNGAQLGVSWGELGVYTKSALCHHLTCTVHVSDPREESPVSSVSLFSQHAQSTQLDWRGAEVDVFLCNSTSSARARLD